MNRDPVLLPVAAELPEAPLRLVWLECLGSHGKVLARHKIDRLPARLGRDYGCDVFVDDARLGDRRVLLYRDLQGHIAALDSTGQRLVVEGAQAPTHSVLSDGTHALLGPNDVLRIGPVRLRVRQAGDRPEAPLARQAGQVQAAAGLVALAGSLGLGILAEMSLSTDAQLTLADVPAFAPLAAKVLVWVAAWSGLGRLVTGRWRWGRHLMLAALGVALWMAWKHLLPLALYAAPAALTPRLTLLGAVLLAVAVAAGHAAAIARGLAVSPAWRRSSRWLTGAAAVAAATWVVWINPDDGRALPGIAATPPPGWVARPAVTLQQALSAVDALRAGAEANAREPASDRLP